MIISPRRCVGLFGAPAGVTHQYYVPSYQPAGQAARSKRRPHCAIHGTHSRSHSRGEFYVAGAVKTDFLFPGVCVCVRWCVSMSWLFALSCPATQTSGMAGGWPRMRQHYLHVMYAYRAHAAPMIRHHNPICFEIDRIKQKISKRQKNLCILTDFLFSLEIDQKH